VFRWFKMSWSLNRGIRAGRQPEPSPLRPNTAVIASPIPTVDRFTVRAFTLAGYCCSALNVRQFTVVCRPSGAA
jgi:hypothetical protein